MEQDRTPNYDRLNQLDELLLEQGIDLSELEDRGVSRISAWQSLIKNDENEAEIHDLMGVELRPRLTPPEWQAEAANITPTRARAKKVGHNVLMCISDMQIDFRRVIDGRTGEQELIPTHDRAAIRAAQMVCKDLQPDYLVNLGDTIDYANLGKYDKDSDHFFKTFGMSHQEVHDMYAQFKANNPDMKMVEVGSNHIDRFMNKVLREFPEAYDAYRAGDESKYPVMSYPYMANLEALDVEWIGGGQEATFWYGEDYTEEKDGRSIPIPPLAMRHGTETGQEGKAVSKIARRRLGMISIHGHAHAQQMALQANRHGQLEGAIVVPPLCQTTGEVSSYHNMVDERNQVVKNQEKWPQGFLIIHDFEGEYVFIFVPIRDGVAYFDGKKYDGNKE